MYLHLRAAPSPSNDALGAGAIAGIVVGVVVFAMILATGIWKYLRSLRANKTIPLRVEDLCNYDGEATVNPWELEYKPNPVIHAHLVTYANLGPIEEASFRSLQTPTNLPNTELASQSPSGLSTLHEGVRSSLLSEKKRYLELEELPTTDSGPSKRRGHGGRATRELLPSIVDLIDKEYESTGTTAQPREKSLNFSPPTTLLAIAQSRSDPDTAERERDEVSLSDSTSGTKSTTVSSATSVDDLSFVCIECSEIHRTRGILNEHMNRKHVRRFQCAVCVRAFHL
jgi:hypothetical protein